MERTERVRFGILGCANIARQVARAITLAPNTALQAIGSRSIDKATSFAAENGFPDTVKIYGSYEEVLDDADVDAVYVPLPTTLHVRWAVAAAEKKKHVLLEKPAAVNVAELDRILAACQVNGVQFMDGTMWIHNPRTPKMKEFLSDEHCFGKLKSTHCTLTYKAGAEFLDKDIRVKAELDSLGALGDLGWYCIRAILWAADYQLPQSVVASCGPSRNEQGVLLSCGSSLHWEDGRVATFHCSFLSFLTFDLSALGTKGSLRLHDLLMPFHEGRASFCTSSEVSQVMKGWAPAACEREVEVAVAQDVAMVTEFGKLIAAVERDGADPEKWWPNVCRKTQLVVDAVKASIDRGFVPVHILEFQ